ncbi:MAG: DUF29 domain-containing protein, partial [Microcoleus sp. SIO2G3]|nr:DUF29 domain-containing protein [Microcoleus sp. SIO2G3]
QIQRREISDLLEENPSLKPYLSEAITKGYQAGIDLARLETSLDYSDLPENCPYSLEQLFDPNFPTDLNPVT